MSDRFIVVDENDTIIWYKTKEELDEANDFYRVSALRLTNSKWEILIAQRAYNKSHNPWIRWPAVAWTVEEWESYEDNIIKETEEEIWLKDIEIIPWPKFKKDAIGKNRHFTQVFTAIIDKDISEFIIQEDEVAAIKRISAEELRKDITSHPENYLKSMLEYVEMFSPFTQD